MSEYTISDYSIIDNAIATTNQMVQTYTDWDGKINECKTVVTDTSVFMGPAADSCNEALTTVATSSKSVSENLGTLGGFLGTVSTKYQQGDKDSLDAIMAITGGNESTGNSVLDNQSALEQYKTLASLQTGGHFETNKYTAKNGTTLKYYLYCPEFSDGNHSGLPLLVFLHGTGGARNAMHETFPKAVKAGMNVPGYILFPQSSKNWSGETKAQDAAAELTKKIATEKNCDMSRISAAGHSDGGYGVHQMVARHSDLFSSYLSYAGGGNEKTLKAVANAHVYTWGFHGTKDGAVNYNKGKTAYDVLESNNPNGTQFTALKGGDHHVASNFWVTTYSWNGQNITPIQWLFTTKKYGTSSQTT